MKRLYFCRPYHHRRNARCNYLASVPKTEDEDADRTAAERNVLLDAGDGWRLPYTGQYVCDTEDDVLMEV